MKIKILSIIGILLMIPLVHSQIEGPGHIVEVACSIVDDSLNFNIIPNEAELGGRADYELTYGDTDCKDAVVQIYEGDTCFSGTRQAICVFNNGLCSGTILNLATTPGETTYVACARIDYKQPFTDDTDTDTINLVVGPPPNTSGSCNTFTSSPALTVALANGCIVQIDVEGRDYSDGGEDGRYDELESLSSRTQPSGNIRVIFDDEPLSSSNGCDMDLEFDISWNVIADNKLSVGTRFIAKNAGHDLGHGFTIDPLDNCLLFDPLFIPFVSGGIAYDPASNFISVPQDTVIYDDDSRSSLGYNFEYPIGECLSNSYCDFDPARPFCNTVTNMCTSSICGNGIIETGETCDPPGPLIGPGACNVDSDYTLDECTFACTIADSGKFSTSCGLGVEDACNGKVLGDTCIIPTGQFQSGAQGKCDFSGLCDLSTFCNNNIQCGTGSCCRAHVPGTLVAGPIAGSFFGSCTSGKGIDSNSAYLCDPGTWFLCDENSVDKLQTYEENVWKCIEENNQYKWIDLSDTNQVEENNSENIILQIMRYIAIILV